MENERLKTGGILHITATAAVSIAVLLVATYATISQHFFHTSKPTIQVAATTNDGQNNGGAGALGYNGENEATSSAVANDLSQIGPSVQNALTADYLALKQAGTYSPAAGAQIAAAVSTSLNAQLSYPTYTADNIKTDSNTSYARMLTYRNDLKTSLAPLLKNSQPELYIFGEYTQTHDQKYLTQLRTAAHNYQDAAALTAKVIAPQDAVVEQVGIVNAMEKFGVTLQSMADNADDPIASATLLKTYTQAESDMFTSFDALYAYYKSKKS